MSPLSPHSPLSTGSTTPVPFQWSKERYQKEFQDHFYEQGLGDNLKRKEDHAVWVLTQMRFERFKLAVALLDVAIVKREITVDNLIVNCMDSEMAKIIIRCIFYHCLDYKMGRSGGRKRDLGRIINHFRCQNLWSPDIFTPNQLRFMKVIYGEDLFQK